DGVEVSTDEHRCGIDPRSPALRRNADPHPTMTGPSLNRGTASVREISIRYDWNGARVAHLGSTRELAPYSRLALAHALAQRSILTLSSRPQDDDKRRRYDCAAEPQGHQITFGS